MGSPRIAALTAMVLLLASLPSGPGEGQPRGAASTPRETLVLSFPPVALREGERIVGVEVVVTHGAVTAISTVPADWSVHLDADPQWQARVSGGPHHGVGALTAASELNPFLAIRPWDDRFDVRATIEVTADFARARTITLGMKDLVLARRR